MSLPRLVEPVYEAVFGPGLLLKTEEITAKAVTRLARYQSLNTVLSEDRSAVGVVAMLPNVGAVRMQELVGSARAFVSREVPAGYQATVTSNLAMTEHVFPTLHRVTSRLSGPAPVHTPCKERERNMGMLKDNNAC